MTRFSRAWLGLVLLVSGVSLASPPPPSHFDILSQADTLGAVFREVYLHLNSLGWVQPTGVSGFGRTGAIFPPQRCSPALWRHTTELTQHPDDDENHPRIYLEINERNVQAGTEPGCRDQAEITRIRISFVNFDLFDAPFLPSTFPEWVRGMLQANSYFSLGANGHGLDHPGPWPTCRDGFDWLEWVQKRHASPEGPEQFLRVTWGTVGRCDAPGPQDSGLVTSWEVATSQFHGPYPARP